MSTRTKVAPIETVDPHNRSMERLRPLVHQTQKIERQLTHLDLKAYRSSFLRFKFKDEETERLFYCYAENQSRGIGRVAALATASAIALIAIVEASMQFASDTWHWVLLLRVLSMAINISAYLALRKDTKRGSILRSSQFVLLCSFVAQLVVVTGIIAISAEDRPSETFHDEDDHEGFALLYAPSSMWIVDIELLLLVMLHVTVPVTLIVLRIILIAFFIVVGLVMAFGGSLSFEDTADNLLALFFAALGTLLSTFFIERKLRSGFTRLVNITHDMKRRHQLLNDMLPRNIKKILAADESTQSHFQNGSALENPTASKRSISPIKSFRLPRGVRSIAFSKYKSVSTIGSMTHIANQIDTLKRSQSDYPNHQARNPKVTMLNANSKASASFSVDPTSQNLPSNHTISSKSFMKDTPLIEVDTSDSDDNAAVGPTLDSKADGFAWIGGMDSHSNLLLRGDSPSLPSVNSSNSGSHFDGFMSSPEKSVAFYYPEVTVLFCYIEDLPRLSADENSMKLVRVLNNLYTLFDQVCEQHGAYKVMAIAEMYLCVAGAPSPAFDHTERIAKVALEMINIVRLNNYDIGNEKLKIRVGFHSGSVAAGIIGSKTRNWHIFGDTVNIASRMCSTSQSMKIQLTETSATLIRATVSDSSAIFIVDRGEVFVKGKGLLRTVWLQDTAVQKREDVSLRMNKASTGNSTVFMVLKAKSLFKSTKNLRDKSLSKKSARLKIFKAKHGSPQLFDLNVQTNDRSPLCRRHSAPCPLSTMKTQDGKGIISQRRKSTGDGPRHLSSASAFNKNRTTNLLDNLRKKFSFKFSPGPNSSSMLKRAGRFFGIHPDDPELESVIEVGMKPHRRLKLTFLDKDIEEHFISQQEEESRNNIIQALWMGCILASVTIVRLLLYMNQISLTLSDQVPVLTYLVTYSVLLMLSRLLLPRVRTSYKVSLGLILAIRCATFTVLASVVIFDVKFPNAHTSMLAFLSASLVRFPFSLVIAANSYGVVIFSLFFGNSSDLSILMKTALIVQSFNAAVIGTTFSFAEEKKARLLFLTERDATEEQRKCQELLLNMLPTKQHAEKLMSGNLVEEKLKDVTFLYSDICQFTELSSKLSPEELIQLLDTLYRAFDSHLDEHNLYKVETIGDAYIVLGGMTSSHAQGHEEDSRKKLDSTGEVALYALDMIDEITNIGLAVGIDFKMRIGIHVGSAVGGIIGWRRPRYFVWGKGTILGNAMESNGTPMQIMVSESAVSRLERQGFVLDTPQTLKINGEDVKTKMIRKYGDRQVLPEGVTLEEAQKQLRKLAKLHRKKDERSNKR